MSGGCTRPPVCNLCAGNHSMRDCKSQIRKCANCEGTHPASSNECPKNRDAKEIEKLRQSGNTFSEARRMVNSRRTEKGDAVVLATQKWPLQHNRREIQVEAEIHKPAGQYFKENTRTYANVTKSKDSTNDTESNANTFTNMKRYIDQAMSAMTVKLVSFMKEVLSLQMMKEHTRERKLLLINLAKHHFGTNIDMETISEHLDFQFPNNEKGTHEKATNEVPKRVEEQEPVIQMEKTTNPLTAQDDANPPSQIIRTRNVTKNQKNAKPGRTNKNARNSNK